METSGVIVVAELDRAVADLAAGRLACPRCSARLRRWGTGRRRTVRGPGGRPVMLHPARARCRSCRTTHVLLPAWCVPRRADAVEVIGAALVAAAEGVGYRRIAAGCGRPASTVRGWLHRAAQRAEPLRQAATGAAYQLDPSLGAIEPRTSPLGDAVEALGHYVGAYTRRFGRGVSAWQLICWFTAGRLLAPAPSG